ncbi:tyrosine-type recombinase/integrase [Candidatus Thiodictyon syntrophicum]|nr:site-specific integrase [Candidatus Thiodictyon syntrophicum]
MPKLRLTDAAVKRVKAPDGADRAEFWDTTQPGFGLRVSASGARSWILIVRALKAGAWMQQRVTLGRYPAVSLAEARALATEARTMAERGQDPARVVQDRREGQASASRNTFAAVRDEFLEKYRGRQQRRPAPRTLSEIERALSSDLFAAWTDRPLIEVAKRDVLDVLDALVERGAEVMANRTLTYLGTLCKWALDREIIKTDPTDGIKKPGAERTRERVLSPGELCVIWRALAETQAHRECLFAGMVKVLALTGQRRDEVTGLRWSEIDGCTWTLPSSRTKNHREHVVHLSAPVLEILEARKSEQDSMGIKSDFVFTTSGAKPVYGWSWYKAKLDACANLAPWTWHDLRRTLATRLAEDLRIPPHVIEATLNHVSGARAGVAGTYNRALYLDERKTALDAWAGYVLRLVGEAELSNVVEFARR